MKISLSVWPIVNKIVLRDTTKLDEHRIFHYKTSSFSCNASDSFPLTQLKQRSLNISS